MCSNPQYIPYKRGTFRTMQVDTLHNRLGLSNPGGYIVPCGKCTECLKKRQNDLAVRLQREAANRGSMVFLTLTYNDDTLPLSVRLVQIDRDTGEILYPYPASPLVRSDDSSSENAEFVRVCRGLLEGMRPGPTPRVVELPWCRDERYEYRFSVTPSLYRRDVRLWLKRCRVRYSRLFGEPLPDFAYVAVGELGPRTCRPHYHLCFLGLSVDIVSWMASQWDYGFFNIKNVNAVNPDGTNGFELAARYVGKYMTKGRFECESVKDGLCEKPRLMLSKHVGTDLPEQLVEYFRCYDLFGRYDINSLVDPHTRSLYTPERLREMHDAICKRSHLMIGSCKYALPRALLIKLWYTYDEIRKVYVCSDFRTACSSASRRDDVLDYIRQCKSDRPSISWREISTMVSEFLTLQESTRFSKEFSNEQNLQRFYSQSIF